MKRFAGWGTLFSLLVFVASPVAALNKGCDIDLSATIATLVRAQAAASGGDSVGAARMIAEARLDLRDFEALCVDDIALGQTYTHTTDAGSLTFRYPSGWALESLEDQFILLANSPTILDEIDFNAPETTPFPPGAVVINVSLADPSFLGVQNEVGDNPSAVALTRAIITDIPESLSVAGEPTTFSVSDRQAARVDFSNDNLDLAVIVVKLDNQGTFGLLLLLTAPGELAAIEEIALGIAASFRLASP